MPESSFYCKVVPYIRPCRSLLQGASFQGDEWSYPADKVISEPVDAGKLGQRHHIPMTSDIVNQRDHPVMSEKSGGYQYGRGRLIDPDRPFHKVSQSLYLVSIQFLDAVRPSQPQYRIHVMLSMDQRASTTQDSNNQNPFLHSDVFGQKYSF